MPAISRLRMLQRWRNFEKCLPLRGKWLAWALVGLVAVLWVLGLQLGGGRWHYRVYFATTPGRPYSWHPAPGLGFDCQRRMLFSFQGEVARSFRVGDLIFETSQDEGLLTGRAALDGPDCH